MRVGVAVRWLSLPVAALFLLAASIGCSSKAVAQTIILPGSFGVTPSGAASFSVPISVPPGTGGLVPSLSLDYDSDEINGVAGVGWKIDGLPAITRCPATLAQDNVAGSIDYDVGITAGQTDHDHFCLNGQRLIPISGKNGVDGTEYRTEIETFSRIISHGYVGASPAYFDVYTKDGRIMEFGNTTDSRAMFTNTTAFPSARAWLVDKVSDRSGNYMTVKYTVDPDTGVPNYNEVVPASVTYTGNSGTGLAPYNKVTFTYTNGTRTDIVPQYTDGNLDETTQLLTDIKTWSGTQASPGSTEVNDYKLAYTTSPTTSRELLHTITLCDSAGSNCLPARTFQYQVNPSGNLFAQYEQSLGAWNLGSPPTINWAPITGDFNADGLTDIAFMGYNTVTTLLSNGNGTFAQGQQNFSQTLSSPPQSQWTPLVGDFNGDGKTDYTFIIGTAPYGNVTDTFLSNGDGTFNVVTNATSGNIGAPPSANMIPIVGDFNGDGLTDFAFIGSNTGSSTIYVFLSNGNGSYTASTQTITQTFTNPPQSGWTPIVGDFTGNGKTDFALVIGAGPYGNVIDAFISNGDGTFNVVTQSTSGNMGSPPSANWTPITGDFNGDGLTDFAFVGATSINTFLSKGDGTFVESTQVTGQNFESPPQATWTPVEGDFTGSGLTDFALLKDDTLWIFLSTGTGTFTLSNQTLVTDGGFGSPPTAAWVPINGDFNGDGQGDFAMVGATSIVTYLSNDLAPDLMTSLSNGLGAMIWLTYGSPAGGKGSYYTGWAPSYSNNCAISRALNNYPATSIDIAPTTPVVTGVFNSNGIGGIYGRSYDYSCALADIKGRGFLGFSNQSVTDPQTGITQNTTFDQAFPFIGEVFAQVKTVVENGTTITLSGTGYNYGALTSTSNPALPWNGTQTAEVAPQFPYISKSVVSRNDLNGAALPTTTTTYTYDGYGNATSVAVSTVLGSTQGPTQTTTNTFQTPNTTAPNWIMGLLTQQQVVSTTP
jgi:hypothetical protein